MSETKIMPLSFLLKVGRSLRFLWSLSLASCKALRRPRLILREMYFAGSLSLLVIFVSGFFVGLVLALQGYYMLQRYGAADALGVFVALSLVRELGPVVSALLFASRAGSAMTAGISMMKAREELDAMIMMGVDPLERVLAPKFLGMLLSLPLLCAFFSAIGVLGGAAVGHGVAKVDPGVFWAATQLNVHFFADVLGGLLKSLVFGALIAWVACFEGLSARSTPDGAAIATTQTVVTSALMILSADFMLTAFMFSW